MSPSPSPRPSLVYFSMEIGFEARLPTYSGGLGVLAGDTLRAAADLGLPMVGVSLVHRRGYFRQMLDEAGRQTTEPDDWAPEELLREVEARARVELRGRTVHVRAFERPVVGVHGDIVPVYLLDTRLPENHEEDRRLTDSLYGGDAEYRLLQEAILGLGGLALLRELGYDGIETFHMNEGHSALLPVGLLEERLDGGTPSPDDVARVREQCVFTTHTPVPAGHDRFPEELVESVLGSDRTSLLRDRGLQDGTLNMSLLALHLSRFANGVAARHGQVSREMFPDHEIYPITNGVHVPTWTSPAMASLFDRHIPGWRSDPYNLRHAALIPLPDLTAARAEAKARLLSAVRERTGVEMDPAVLTVGFARRSTPYKRIDLLFHDPERLRRMACDYGGLQVVYSGKAHPEDTGGQDMIRAVHHAAEVLEGDVPVVWLPDYDMELGGLITSGVDLWLNNPEKPKEASGTSGMKAALNGIPNLSTLDGWWIEGHMEGVTGWSLSRDWRGPSDREREAEVLYTRLEEDILPLYYDDAAAYDRIRRNTITLNGPHFSARRMMQQYVDVAYPRRDPAKVGD